MQEDIRRDTVAVTDDVQLVQTGADSLVSTDFQALKGFRVGLVTNHTALVEGRHLIDLMSESESVTLSALYGPEHGIIRAGFPFFRFIEGRARRVRQISR